MSNETELSISGLTNASNNTDAFNITVDLVQKVATSSSLLWSLPKLLTSLSKAAEEQARQSHDAATRHNITSFNYFISPYAGACMFMAIVLNRTVVFASSRRQSDRLARGPKSVLRLVSLYAIASALWDVALQFARINPWAKSILSNYMPESPQSLDSLLWEIFTTLCVSQFLETFLSIASAQQPTNDSGLTLFEHSLAFQECQFLENPSPQLLIICTFSLVTQLVTHIMGFANWKKYQLIPSTILGVGFLAFYCYSAYTDTLIYFPGIVVVSVIPQLLVLLIIGLCLIIYALAVIVTRDPSNLTYTPMVHNLNDSLNLQLHDDFNSFLMRFGFIMFNAVENEEYVNEVSELRFSRGTYQDKKYFLSGYFNKLDNNPELLNQKKRLKKGEESIFNNWSFLRKLMNVVRLCQSIFKFVCKIRNPKANNQADESLSMKIRPQTTHYSSLLANENSELDDSEDYVPDSDSEVDALEYNSETDDDQVELEYIPTLAMTRRRDAPTQLSQSTSLGSGLRQRPIDELFGPRDVAAVLAPTDVIEASYINTIRTHMVKDRRLTRSQYCALDQDTVLRELILSRRPHYDEHNNDDNDLNCVVCQTERRCIVLWPCKCFALCEGCRLSLGVRGFAICVCCRAKVDGYSKVFMP